MRNYFQNMVFADIVAELKRIDGEAENADLDNLGQKMMIITAMIVCPKATEGIDTIEMMTEEAMNKACELVVTEEFSNKF